ncbi:MAG: alpha/beta hydrolase family protein [Solirubrobacterales bacterium]
MRLPPPREPHRRDVQDALAYDLWIPDGPPPWPGVVILHGAGSRKENHTDFARAAVGNGYATVNFDQRGHGATGGLLSPATMFADVLTMVRLLVSVDGVDAQQIALRGSSLGGNIAIHAAARSSEVAAVVAICPAGEEHLLRGLRAGHLEMDCDIGALEAHLGEHDVRDAVTRLDGRPLLLHHAEGDEQIPVAHSRELAAISPTTTELIAIPGGHHRSIQHDPDLQAHALRWLDHRFGRRGKSRRR